MMASPSAKSCPRQPSLHHPGPGSFVPGCHGRRRAPPQVTPFAMQPSGPPSWPCVLGLDRSAPPRWQTQLPPRPTPPDQRAALRPAFAGAGNLQPLIGTGTIWYTQAGFLLPNKNEKPKVRVQPFGAYTYKKFDAFEKASNQFDIGTNLFLDGHHAKLTAQYSTRPVYTTKDNIDTYKGEFLLQLQIYL